MSQTAADLNKQIALDTRGMQGSALNYVAPESSQSNRPEDTTQLPGATVFVTHKLRPNEPPVRAIAATARALPGMGIEPVLGIPQRDGSFLYVSLNRTEPGAPPKTYSVDDMRDMGVTSIVVPALDALENREHIDRMQTELLSAHGSPVLVLEGAGSAEVTREYRTATGMGMTNYLAGLFGKVAGIRYTTPDPDPERRRLADTRSNWFEAARVHLGPKCRVEYHSGTARNADPAEVLGLMINDTPRAKEALAKQPTLAQRLGVKVKTLGTDSLAANSGTEVGRPLA